MYMYNIQDIRTDIRTDIRNTYGVFDQLKFTSKKVNPNCMRTTIEAQYTYSLRIENTS